MADTKLTGLTEQTVLASDDWLYSVDKSDTTDDAAGSSRKLATSTLLKWSGGLTPNAQTITTADVTGAVGQLYVCTIAGLTANRNLTLPSATAGERLGVYVADGDDTYALILIGAASQTINGGSAATEWSRVFIKGECVVFLCVAANTWIVESDGRIPCQCNVTLSAAITTNSAGTAKAVEFNTETYDTGDIYDHVTNKYMTCRRAGTYAFDGFLFPNAGIADQMYYAAFLYNDVVASFTKSYSIDARRNSAATPSQLATCAFLGAHRLAVADKVVPAFYAQDANMGVVHEITTAPHKWKTFFAANEQL